MDVEGYVVNVFDRAAGSELSADVAAGASTISVDDLTDFDLDNGGVLSISDGTNREGHTYTVPSGSTGAITLGQVTTNAFATGSRVNLYYGYGLPKVVERWADIREPDSEELLRCLVPAELTNKSLLRLGVRAEGDSEHVVASYEYGDLVIRNVYAAQEGSTTATGENAWAANVMDYGAVGDGVTNDAAAFQDAVSSGAPIIYAPEGTYYFGTSGVGFQGGQTFMGAGRERTVITGDGTSGQGLLGVGGGLGTSKALTANATLGGNTLTVASTTGIAGGDYILITSNAQPFPAEASAHAGEIRRVEGVSATVITIDGRLDDNYLTADTAIVRRISQVVGNTFRDFTIEQNFGNTSFGIEVEYGRDTTVRDVTFRGNHYNQSRVLLRTCVGFLVDNLRFTGGATDLEGSPFGYGVNATSSQDGIVSNCKSNRGHGAVFTTNGDTAGNGGVPRHILVTNCIAVDNYTMAFFCHESSEDITFQGCKVYGRNTSYSTVGGHGLNFGLYGFRTKLLDCVTEGTVGHGCQIGGDAVEVRGCIFRNCATGAGALGVGIFIGTSSLACYVADNHCLNCEEDGIYMTGQNGRFNNNRVSGATYGIRFNSSTDDHVVSGLEAEDCTTAAVYWTAPSSPNPNSCRGVVALGSTPLLSNKALTVVTGGPWPTLAQPNGVITMGTSNPVANSLYGQAFYLPDGGVTTGVRIRNTTANGNIQAALFVADGSSKISTASSTAVTATVQNLAWTATNYLRPGVYWAVVQFSSATAVTLAATAAAWFGPTYTSTQGAFSIPSTITTPALTSTASAALNMPLQLY